MDHKDCLESFCLWPLHPGPCRGTSMRQQPRMAPGASHGRARVGAPPAKAAPPAQRPAAGRARVGGPPAPVPAKKTAKAAKKAPAKKAAPQADRNGPSNRAASEAGAVADILMGGTGNVTPRFVEGLMGRVRAAHQRDQQAGRGGPDSDYSRVITEEAHALAAVLANSGGGTPQERRQRRNRYANIISEAMRSGNPAQARALRRELDANRSRTASAAPSREMLALYGLQLDDSLGRWHQPPVALVASPLASLAHLDCNLSVFCRNPLHPGPCKGWKGTLAKVAPGALATIEAERKKKLAAKKAAKEKAQAAAKKIVDKAKRGVEVDAHPAAKKKLAAKATAQILGDDEEKVAAIEGKTKLSKKEMAWHANKKAAALLAANLAAGNLAGGKAAQQKYRQYVRAEIMKALEADNETGATGPDSEYQKTIAGLSQAISGAHANKHVEITDDASADLHVAVADAFDAAIQQDLKDAKAGSTPVNLKKLEKALAAIPGNAGEAEHDVAVGKAVGHDYTPAEPSLPAGALSDEDAEKLASGAEQVALITGSPASAAAGKANAKKLAQLEGFTDKQAVMVEKTATKNAAVAVSQQWEATEGFSPQGKKKLEKLLAAEMQEMIETGQGPKPGSLAELVAMRKSGAISAEDLHVELMKKLKIKSKTHNPDGSPKATAPPPAPAAPGAPSNDGGAGAGGPSKGKATAQAFSDIADAAGEDALPASTVPGLEKVLDSPDYSPEAKADLIKATADQQAKMLVKGMGLGAKLTPDEAKALEQVVGSMVEVALNDPKYAPSAKTLIKNLKSKSPKELKAFANGLLPESKKTQPSAPAAPSTPAAKAKAAKAASSQINKALGMSDDLADDDAEMVASKINGGKNAAEEIDAQAAYLAGAMYDGNGANLSGEQQQKLLEISTAKFKKAMETGDPADIEAATKWAKMLKTGTTSQLAFKLSTADDEAPTPAAATGPGTPMGASVSSQDQAVKIAAGLKDAYEQLTNGDDGSALASPSAVQALADSLDGGATPEAKAKQAAMALAKQIVAAKVAGKSGMPPIHQEALAIELAAEIEAGILSGTMDGPLIKSLSSPKGGFTKIKIKAKQAYNKNGAYVPGAGKGSSPLFPSSSKDAAVDKALDDAFGPTPGTAATPAAPAKVNDNLVDNLAKLPGLPSSVYAQLNELADEYDQASPADKPAVAKKLAGIMAGTVIGHAMQTLDIVPDDSSDSKFQMADLAASIKALTADYEAAILADADDPGGAASKMQAIVTMVAEQAVHMANNNAYDPKGPAITSFKTNLFGTQLATAIKYNPPATKNPGGGAGAGGTGTGTVPTAGQAPVNVSALPKGSATYSAPTPTAATLPKGKKKAKALPQAGPAPDLTEAKRVGEQGGYTKGGTYETPDGTRYYVKEQKTVAQARNEATAAALYRAAGIDIPAVSVQEGTADDLSGTLSSTRIVEGASPMPDPPSPAQLRALRRGFAVDAWLANWDAVGVSLNNVILGPDGEPIRVDAGGALEYGGAGFPKGDAFGNTVGEINTLRDPNINPAMAKLFASMTDEEMIESMEQVEAVTPAKIRAIVKAQGGDKALAAKLIARRADIVKQLNKLRGPAAVDPTTLGIPSTLKPANVALGGTKKKQLILKPQGDYPISQVVLQGHEAEVAEFNARVAAAPIDQSADIPRRMGDTGALGDGSQYDSLYAYTDSSWAINAHLRAGGRPAPSPGKVDSNASTSEAPAHIAHIDAAMEQSRLTQGITTVRGFRGSEDIFGDLWTTHRDRNWAGAEIRDLAYSSSTVQMGTARNFSGAGPAGSEYGSPDAVIIRAYLPAGTRAINLGGDGVFGGEAEILLNRGARFRIVADNGFQDGARHLDVEVICDGDGCADTI